MSIIQEALKKGQEALEDKRKPSPPQVAGPEPQLQQPPAAIAEEKRSGPRHRTDPRVVFALLLVLVALSGLALKQLSGPKPAATAASSAPLVAERIEARPPAAAPIIQKAAGEGTALLKPFSLPRQTPNLVLNGIMYLEDGPRAIINNAIVKEGDSLSGALVRKIDKRSVTLDWNGEEMTLNLK